jgi:two-component system, chemotaxis family, protein-glutamate methylesterase/glutaminase
MIDRSYMYITHGPRENMSRPAVDPLFRSAAVVHGPHVIGVILSGALDDGAAGLLAIKRCGGLAIVQDPEDALYPDMPRNALEIVDVDACMAVGDLPALLTHLARTESERGRERNSASFHNKAAEIQEHTERLRQLLLSLNQ